MKIKFFLTALALGFASLASAQIYQDVVFLKNGSEIRGVIMEQIPNESLKIKTSDGSLFVFKIDEVSKISKEEMKGKRREVKADADDEERIVSPVHRTTGYVGKVESAIGGDGDGLAGSISTTHGVRLGSRVFLGGGLGLTGGYVFYMPVYCNVRFDFIDTRFTPYLDLRTGVGFGDDVGAYGEIGTGVRIAFTSKLALSAGFLAEACTDNGAFVGFNVGFEF